MTYSDPEKKRAYQREYYRKKLAPGGEKYEAYRAYQREYYREQLGVDGEKHEQNLERNRVYYREQLGVGGEKHQHYSEKHRAYNKTIKRANDIKWARECGIMGGINVKKRTSLRGADKNSNQSSRGTNSTNQLFVASGAGRMTRPACIFTTGIRPTKKRNIASYVFASSSLEKFIAELQKCDVLVPTAEQQT